MVKKCGYTEKQLSNLSAGRRPKKKKKVEKNVFKRGSKFYRHFGTTMSPDNRYNRQNPSPATKTKLDELQGKVLLALPRIDKARPPKAPRTVFETTMLLQFILRFIITNVCMLTNAVDGTTTIFWLETCGRIFCC